MLADTQAEICSQAMPQLDAALTEIKKNDLTSLQNNINNCQGKTTEECKVVNGLTGDFNSLKSQITQFNASVENVRALCAKPASEEDFKTLADTLNMIKTDGQTLKDAAQSLQADQSQEMTASKLCRAVVPQFQTAKEEISGGLAEMNAIKSGCAGKNDIRCSVINSNSGKFDALNNQIQQTLKKISDVSAKCANASTDKLDQSLVDLLDSIKQDKDTIDKMIAGGRGDFGYNEAIPSGPGGQGAGCQH